MPEYWTRDETEQTPKAKPAKAELKVEEKNDE